MGCRGISVLIGHNDADLVRLIGHDDVAVRIDRDLLQVRVVIAIAVRRGKCAGHWIHRRRGGSFISPVYHHSVAVDRRSIRVTSGQGHRLAFQYRVTTGRQDKRLHDRCHILHSHRNRHRSVEPRAVIVGNADCDEIVSALRRVVQIAMAESCRPRVYPGIQSERCLRRAIPPIDADNMRIELSRIVNRSHQHNFAVFQNARWSHVCRCHNRHRVRHRDNLRQRGCQLRFIVVRDFHRNCVLVRSDAGIVRVDMCQLSEMF